MLVILKGTRMLMRCWGMAGVVDVIRPPLLLTKLLLCLLLLQTTDFLLLLPNFLLLHPGSSVTGLPEVALNPLLLARCTLHQEGLAQAGLC